MCVCVCVCVQRGSGHKLTSKLVRLRSNAERASERALKAMSMGRPMRTSSVLSSCSTRALCESALGMAIIEYDSAQARARLSNACGEGFHRRQQTARLRVGRVVDAGEADAERDREGGLVRGEGHLVQDDGLEVALVLGGAAQVHELALRTPPT